MILAGAGGHALEVFDYLRGAELIADLEVYDADPVKQCFKSSFPILHHAEDLQQDSFCLGVGTPAARASLYALLTQQGKKAHAIHHPSAEISPDSSVAEADICTHCFIGPEVHIGQGSLINVGAQIHHEVQIGTFSVINPGALLLGAVQIGNFCSIGAHATILPGIKIGNQVTIGAGAVVIRDVEDGMTVVGVPAVAVKSKSVDQ